MIVNWSVSKISSASASLVFEVLHYLQDSKRGNFEMSKQEQYDIKKFIENVCKTDPLTGGKHKEWFKHVSTPKILLKAINYDPTFAVSILKINHHRSTLPWFLKEKITTLTQKNHGTTRNLI
jgi:dTDP-glucose pyrophosphorylase